MVTMSEEIEAALERLEADLKSTGNLARSIASHADDLERENSELRAEVDELEGEVASLDTLRDVIEGLKLELTRIKSDREYTGVEV